MSSDGWILLHRRIRRHWLWEPRRPRSQVEAWLDLVMRANYEDRRVHWQGRPITVRRAQLVTSERTLAEAWNWSRGKVRRFLEKLEGEVDAAGQPDPMITREPAHQGVRVTICAYSDYQGSHPASRPTDRPAGGPPEAGNESAHDLISSPRSGPPTGPPAARGNPNQRGASTGEAVASRPTDEPTDRPACGPPADRRQRSSGPLRNKGTIKKELEEGGGVGVPAALAPLDSLLDRARLACAATRKTGVMADSVWEGTLAKLASYPADAVRAAIRTYLDREYHLEKPPKDERYLVGIARGKAEELAARRARDAREANDGLPTGQDAAPPARPPAVEVGRDAGALWRPALEVLEQELDPQTFDTWFRPIAPAGTRDGKFLLLVPNEVFADWLTQKYQDLLERAVGMLVEVAVGVPSEADEQLQGATA